MSFLKRAAPVLAAALCCLLPIPFLNGCEGGTSSTAENPAFWVGFRKDGKRVEFEGQLMVYAAVEKPSFFFTRPADVGNPYVEMGPSSGWANTTQLYGSKTKYSVDGRFMSEVSDTRMSFPIPPPEMEGDRLPVIALQGKKLIHDESPFNIVVQNETLTGFAQGITLDTAKMKYRDANGDLIDTLMVDLTEPVSVSGVLDTAGVKHAPLLLFMPGLPYTVRMHGDRFRVKDFPQAKLAMRLLNAKGEVLALKEPLDLTSVKEGSGLDTLPVVVSGNKIDTVSFGREYPTLAAPAATPAGPYSFVDSVVVTLSASEGALIHYSTQGELPGLHTTRYSKPLVLRASTTLMAVAFKEGSYRSPIAVNSYLLVPPKPKATPAGQDFQDSLLVTLSTMAKNGSILYTMDGSSPSTSSPRYGGPLTLKATTVLRAVTSVPGLGLSEILEERYNLLTDSIP